MKLQDYTTEELKAELKSAELILLRLRKQK